VNGKERFLTALKGGKPDRVPIFDFLEGRKIFKTVLGKDVAEPEGGDIAECSIKIGFDAAFVAYGGFVCSGGVEKGKTYTDEWGAIYKSTGVSWPIDKPIGWPVNNWSDLREWLKSKPDPHEESRLDDINKAIDISNGKIAILGGVLGPLTIATFVLGFTNTLIKLLDDPKIVKEVFKVANYFHNVAADRMIKAGVDGVFIAEDLGFKSGTFASPEIYREHLFPYIFEQFDNILEKNVPILFHSDGNINDILDDLVEGGISAIQPLERNANMDIGRIRKKYGNKLCLIGNVSASDTLPYGPKERIIQETKDTIKIAGKDGAYVLGSDSDYHDGIPPENFILMVETGKKFGDYPILF